MMDRLQVSTALGQDNEYGVTKGCFFHGDVHKSQLKELGNTIAREHGSGEYTTAISGHKHFRKADNKSGLMMHQTTSLSGSDLWHDKNLYTGLPGLQSFRPGPEPAVHPNVVRVKTSKR